MAHHEHATSEVPAELLARHSNGWKSFTTATTTACVAVAGLLVLMLVFLVIL